MTTDGDIGQVLERTLLPGVCYEPFPSLGGLVGGRGQASETWATVVGQLEEAGGTMIGNGTVVIDLETLEALADKVLVAGIQGQGIGRGRITAGGRGRRLVELLRGGTCWAAGAGGGGELCLELLDTLLQTSSV